MTVWSCLCVQGQAEPQVLVTAHRRSVHRDGPLGGPQQLVYNIGMKELGGLRSSNYSTSLGPSCLVEVTYQGTPRSLLHYLCDHARLCHQGHESPI